ncbi:MAG: hypothetical protein ACJA1L_003631 [Paracoccaceae bacterium]|jgi:uncharacterized protein (TIGR00369 family)
MDTASALKWYQIEHSGFIGLIGPVMIARSGEAEWRFALDVTAQHLNMGGVCHGGASLTLLDTGMGAAVYESAGRKRCATIQLDSHFIAAAKEGQRMEGVARIIRRTEELAFVEGELFAGGRQTMRASGVWKYLSER